MIDSIQAAPHPLTHLNLSATRNWPNWLGRWNDNKLTFEERLGLLATGFDATSISQGDDCQRVRFYLHVADSYLVPIVSGDEEEFYDSVVARNRLATAAMAALIEHVFHPRTVKSGNRTVGSFHRKWTEHLADDRMIEELLCFLRPHANFVGLINIDPVNGNYPFRDTQASQLRHFLFDFIEYVWDSADLAYRPRLVKILAGTGIHFRILRGKADELYSPGVWGAIEDVASSLSIYNEAMTWQEVFLASDDNSATQIAAELLLLTRLFG